MTEITRADIQENHGIIEQLIAAKGFPVYLRVADSYGASNALATLEPYTYTVEGGAPEDMHITLTGRAA